MPYIKQELIGEWDKIVEKVLDALKYTDEENKEGCLNYFITKILKSAYPEKYFNYNRIAGLLECIKQEFYRKIIAPYEDKKIAEHGDVK